MYPYQSPFGPDPVVMAEAIRIAERLNRKKENREKKDKEAKKKAEADEKKKSQEAKHRTLLSLEWYILGILSYPFVIPLYRIATNHLEVLQHVRP